MLLAISLCLLVIISAGSTTPTPKTNASTPTPAPKPKNNGSIVEMLNSSVPNTIAPPPSTGTPMPLPTVTVVTTVPKQKCWYRGEMSEKTPLKTIPEWAKNESEMAEAIGTCAHVKGCFILGPAGKVIRHDVQNYFEVSCYSWDSSAKRVFRSPAGASPT